MNVLEMYGQYVAIDSNIKFNVSHFCSADDPFSAVSAVKPRLAVPVFRQVVTLARNGLNVGSDRRLYSWLCFQASNDAKVSFFCNLYGFGGLKVDMIRTGRLVDASYRFEFAYAHGYRSVIQKTEVRETAVTTPVYDIALMDVRHNTNTASLTWT